jgi:nickel-dependent lactate racemase
MRIAVDYGRERVEFEVAPDKLIASPAAPAAMADPAAAVGAALERPVGYPALRRALTPDDRVVVVVDERLPQLARLLVPLLEYVVSAGVSPEALTMVCPPSPSTQPWADELPEALEEVRIEVADPTDRGRLSYLATTSDGRRLYLSRTVVDADQAIVLSACRYDPLLGYSGAEGALYPSLSDEATRKALQEQVDLDVSEDGPWPARVQATESAWLLGAPFFVQVIEAAGDGIASVVAGVGEASAEAYRQLNAAWRHEVSRPAELVIACVSGDPSRHTFADLAAAAATAAHVVRPGGRIVVLSKAAPVLGDEISVLRQGADAQEVLARLPRKPALEQVAAFRWALAARHAHLTLHSGLPDDVVEDLFATPLPDARQVQRLLDAAGSCIFLADAHKARAVLAKG